jgi:hypothetical protein
LVEEGVDLGWGGLEVERHRVGDEVGGEVVHFGVGVLAVVAQQLERGVGVDPVGQHENAFGLLDDGPMLGGFADGRFAAARRALRRSVVRSTTWPASHGPVAAASPSIAAEPRSTARWVRHRSFLR